MLNSPECIKLSLFEELTTMIDLQHILSVEIESHTNSRGRRLKA
jgi:hypothetical protein